MPRLPERTYKGDKKQRPTDRKYTAMALAALSAGLTWRDLRHMKYTHVVQVIYAYDDMRGDGDYDEVREATSSDIRALMSL